MNEQAIKKILTESIADGINKVMLRIYQTFIIGFLVVLVVLYLTGEFEYDDTDGAARSNMGLHTDNKTGCQYLSTKNGGITPRLTKNGKHAGCEI